MWRTSGEIYSGSNLYADKSAVVLSWLLLVGIDRDYFSLRHVVRATGVSIGLVQRVFRSLVHLGFLKAEGVRTNKRFSLVRPELLLKSWMDHYSIVKKCKMWRYRSGVSNPRAVVWDSDFSSRIALALHSAAGAHNCKNTNLETVELYLLDPTVRGALEERLDLEPTDSGYEVLLVQPYYKTLLGRDLTHFSSSALLTFLDLYHFPLRGREQAEFMAERIPELRTIFAGGSHE